MRWENLCVEADVPANSHHISTVASASLAIAKAVLPGASKASMKRRVILNNVSGALEPVSR